MALVEGVGSEGTPVLPDFLQNLRVVAVGFSALDEFGVHVVQLLDEFLAHRLSECIALAAGEVGDFAGEEHDLLLIDRDAVGVLQIFLHARQVIDNRLLPVLSGDELWDILHRSGTVERVHGDEVLEGRGSQVAEVALHAR